MCRYDVRLVHHEDFGKSKIMTVYDSLRRSCGLDKTSEIMVVLCFCSKDSQLMIKMVDWMGFMEMPKTHDCFLSYDTNVSPRDAELVRQYALEVFNEVRVHCYPKAKNDNWPQGPNYAFQQTASFINSHINQPWLFLEYDQIPLVPDWLIQLQEEYDVCGLPFMGHIVNRLGHMNGGGVYPHDFASICPEAMSCTDIAFDWAMRHYVVPRCCPANDLIEQTESRPFRTVDDVRVRVRNGTILFHQSKDGTLIDRLKEMLIS